MRSASLVLLPLLLWAGCANPSGNPELAREAVLKYVGEGVGTVGPFNRKDKAELASLSAADREKAVALLDRGAWGFLVFGPDTSGAVRAPGGKLADLVQVDRIVFVQNEKVVGDFAAVK